VGGSGAVAQASVRHAVAVTDDQVDMRELIALRLALVHGLDVVGQAANGVEAISLARERRPDLMTLDLDMPVMGGAEAIPVMRAVAPDMRIVVYSGHAATAELTNGSRPDAVVSKGTHLADLVATILRVLSEVPPDVVQIDLGRFSVRVAADAFDSWVGLNARVRAALANKDDISAELLGDVPVNAADLVCLMGVFMQLGPPLLAANHAGDTTVDLKFSMRRDAGVAARRALLALGGNGTLRAFNKAWSHRPTAEAEQALDLVDSRLVAMLPVS
jgi:DNA-binding NarL/FixJ family response regulator